MSKFKNIFISKKKIASPFAIFALLALLTLACAMCLPAKQCFAATVDRENWMSHLSDYTYVSHLTIPGTHDSATYNVKCSAFLIGGVIEDGATCQSCNMEVQMKSGIRAFDLRYKWENGKFYLYHGQGSYACKCRDENNNHLDLEASLVKFQKYLKDHPGEFIMINVQKESGDNNDAELKKLLDKYGVVGRTDNTEVKDVRGKIVNGSDFMQAPGGSSPYNRWTAETDQKVKDMQEVFSKAEEVRSGLLNVYEQKVIYTNMSWRGGWKFTKMPLNWAKEFHKAFFSKNPFEKYGQRAYGVIFYDFPTHQIVDWTIAANNWAKKA